MFPNIIYWLNKEHLDLELEHSKKNNNTVLYFKKSSTEIKKASGDYKVFLQGFIRHKKFSKVK